MIEISVKYVDGVEFIDKVKIISWEKRNGLPVQLVDHSVYREAQAKEVLKSLMLEEVDYDPVYDMHIYAQRPVNDLVYKFVKLSYHAYWKIVRFLYDNARMFKEIPPSERFSWSYFTPLVWLRSFIKLCKTGGN